MRKTVAKIIHNGTYRVVYDETSRTNPYTIYREWYDNGKHTAKVVSYADMYSCMYFLANTVR